MPIYQTATYPVNAGAVEAVKVAIAECVDHVRANEPGTRLYSAWQQESDPTRVVWLGSSPSTLPNSLAGRWCSPITPLSLTNGK